MLLLSSEGNDPPQIDHVVALFPQPGHVVLG